MKVVNSIKIICCSFLISICSYGQIFEGSNGDGFDRESVSAITLTNVSTSVLYDGSNGDGFSLRALNATTLDNTNLAVLYDGSNGDGFSLRAINSITLDNTSLAVLYDGSNGDGFSLRALNAITLDNTSLAVLYDGSNGDGFSLRALNSITLNNTSLAVLYDGSNGDGFSLRLLPATTLDNTNLAVLYDGSKGDGFDLELITSFLDPNAVVDLRLNITALLQGPILNPETPGLMNDILRDIDMLPTTSPYADFAVVNASVFNTGGTSGNGSENNDIVDWVWVEIRNKDNNTAIVDSKSALIQRDGDIVGLDGVSDLILRGVTDSYYVAVKHRNHLGIMSANTLPLSVSSTDIMFSTNVTSTFGTNAQVQLSNGNMALWAGNVNNDNLIQYSGTTPDSPSILSAVLNDPGNFLNFPTFIINGYSVFDINMDGNAQYTGTNPDNPIILQNVLAHPSNIFNFNTFQIIEQLPEN